MKFVHCAARQAALLQEVADGEPGWRVVAVFCDLNSGAARPGRDGGIRTAPDGFDVLLVMGLDRRSRDTDEWGELISQLTAADVTPGTVYRPDGLQGGAEILAVDTFRVDAYRTLARMRRLVRALPAGPAPTSGESAV